MDMIFKFSSTSQQVIYSIFFPTVQLSQKIEQREPTKIYCYFQSKKHNSISKLYKIIIVVKLVTKHLFKKISRVQKGGYIMTASFLLQEKKKITANAQNFVNALGFQLVSFLNKPGNMLQAANKQNHTPTPY